MIQLECNSASSATALNFRDGFILRPGLFRESNAASTYLHSTRERTVDYCPFCDESSQNVVHSDEDMFAFTASASYRFWGNRSLDSHELIVPREHTNRLTLTMGNRAARAIGEYVNYRRQTNPNLQFYVRDPHNPSKSVDHVHCHLLDPSLTHQLGVYAYDITRGASFDFQPAAQTVDPHRFYLKDPTVDTSHITDTDDDFTVVASAEPPIGHFDGQQIVGYEQLHLSHEPTGVFGNDDIANYLAYRRDSTPKYTFLQIDPHFEGPSDPYIDIYTLGLNPVKSINYSPEGLEVDFVTMTDQQRAKLISSRVR